jgi:hypothetical protein
MMSMVSLKAYLAAGILEPFHDGVIRYLKEKGVWTAAHQKRNDTLVALMKTALKCSMAPRKRLIKPRC